MVSASFVVRSVGPDVFVHVSDLLERPRVAVGDEVEYEIIRLAPTVHSETRTTRTARGPLCCWKADVQSFEGAYLICSNVSIMPRNSLHNVCPDSISESMDCNSDLRRSRTSA